MREGYTSQAKKALAYAVKTAEKCGHNYVGTEHLLIGLLNVEDGTAGMVLTGSSPWGLFGSFLDKQKGTFVLCIEKGDAEKKTTSPVSR